MDSCIVIPPPNEVGGGLYWIHLVRPSRANIHVTIDCSAVLPFVLGAVTRQKPQFNGSVVLGADESPWPCGTPSWYTPPYRIWFWVSRRIFIYSHHNTFVLFSKDVRPSVRPSVCRWHGFRSISQVCFGISISNFICLLMVAIGRSLLIFSNVTVKMATWRPYWIIWFQTLTLL